jgi:hypothetical protein
MVRDGLKMMNRKRDWGAFGRQCKTILEGRRRAGTALGPKDQKRGCETFRK